jgi:hypothetical protein
LGWSDHGASGNWWALVNGALVNKGDEAEIWNYAIAMAFRDFGKEGNALGFIFGMPPRARGNDVISRRDLDTSYRVESFFRYKLTNNIFSLPVSLSFSIPNITMPTIRFSWEHC